ncbi:MAG: Uma2 family endonuclease [Caldilineaceae bacterium]
MTLVRTPERVEQDQEQRIAMSYEQFLTELDEDVHAEWVNGETIIFMPPNRKHQAVVSFLVALLRTFADFFQLGEVLAAPFEMKVSPDSNGREPDILFIAKENLGRITEQKLEGPADLLIEVISKESVSRDRSDKFYEYQDAGVREYWLFDPRPRRKRADFWVLDANGLYRPVPLDKGIYHSTILPNFWLNTQWLWQDELPDPLSAFARIVGPDTLIAFLQQMKENDLL